MSADIIRMDFGFLIPFLFFLFFFVLPAINKSKAKTPSKRTPSRTSVNPFETSSSSRDGSLQARLERAKREAAQRGAGQSNSSPNGRMNGTGSMTKRQRNDNRAAARKAARAALTRVAASKPNARTTEAEDAVADIEKDRVNRVRAGNNGRSDWGTRGDKGFGSGKAFIIYALVAFLAYYIITRAAPNLLPF